MLAAAFGNLGWPGEEKKREKKTVQGDPATVSVIRSFLRGEGVDVQGSHTWDLL